MSLEEEQSTREKNKQVVSEYTTEFWGNGNTDVVDKLCADDFVSDCPLHGRRQGKAQVKKMILDFREASLYLQPQRVVITNIDHEITNITTGFSRFRNPCIWINSHDSRK